MQKEEKMSDTAKKVFWPAFECTRTQKLVKIHNKVSYTTGTSNCTLVTKAWFFDNPIRKHNQFRKKILTANKRFSRHLRKSNKGFSKP